MLRSFSALRHLLLCLLATTGLVGLFLASASPTMAAACCRCGNNTVRSGPICFKTNATCTSFPRVRIGTENHPLVECRALADSDCANDIAINTVYAWPLLATTCGGGVVSTARSGFVLQTADGAPPRDATGPANKCWQCDNGQPVGPLRLQERVCFVRASADGAIFQGTGALAAIRMPLRNCHEVSGACVGMEPGVLYQSTLNCGRASTRSVGGSVVFEQAATPPPTAAPSAPVSEPPRPFRSINPNPSVPIPGVEFSPATQNGTSVSVPFLAQYIGGIFRFAIGIGAIVASIMVVYGGFRYLMSASLPDVKDGKETIKDAILGLVVLLGSYVILQTINPELLNLRPLSLSYVQSIDAQVTQGLNTNTGPTGGADFDAPAGRAVPENCPLQNLPEGHYRCGEPTERHPRNRSCTPAHCAAINRPVPCEDSGWCHIVGTGRVTPWCQSHMDPRVQAFANGINSFVHTTDPVERVAVISRAAIDCQLQLGSCNNAAGTVRWWAGYTHRPSRIVAPQLPQVFAAARTIQCERPGPCPHSPPPDANCTHNMGEATQRVRVLARAQQDALADQLLPGDWLYIYNGNNADCAGMHSILFIGWEPDRKHGIVFQGEEGKRVKGGRVCLRTSCPGGRFSPIMKVQ